jgi:type I restriction enzyme, S subunit
MSNAPEGWEAQRLGSFGDAYGGLTGKTKRDFGDGDARYVTFMNVISNVVIDCETFGRVRVSQTEAQNLVLRNDLLFNGSSETPEEVAFCAVHLADIPRLFLNSFCFGVRLRRGAPIDPLFLAYFFRSRRLHCSMLSSQCRSLWSSELSRRS